MTSRPIIKVCGMRETENIREVEALGIDWLGMIFWPKSKRYVATPPSYLPTDVKKVGVGVSSDTGSCAIFMISRTLSGVIPSSFATSVTLVAVFLPSRSSRHSTSPRSMIFYSRSPMPVSQTISSSTQKERWWAAMVSNSTGAYSSTTTVPRPIFSVAASVPKTPNEYIHSSTTITSVTAFWNTGS